MGVKGVIVTWAECGVPTAVVINCVASSQRHARENRQLCDLGKMLIRMRILQDHFCKF